MIQQNKKWYSIIVAILVIGFLLVLSSWILNLVISELKDTSWETDYIKAFAAAEWASELALLKIKTDWYGVKDSILVWDPREKILWDSKKDTKINYDLNYTVLSYSGKIDSAWYDIIPLFYTNEDWEHKVIDLELSSSSLSNISNLAWNIVSNNWWIVWSWAFNKDTIWYWKDSDQEYFEKTVWNFLFSNSWNYLMLFNIDESNPIEYSLKSRNGTYFTLPRADILSSAKLWKYKQNLQTHLDNTEFLWLLKYSLYSDSD